MKITIIYDNTSVNEKLREDWGFSCLVEAHGRKILFDTGADGTVLLHNMEKLGLDPKDVEEIFISHAHWDHTGGLREFLEVNPVPVFIPESFQEYIGEKNVHVIKESSEIHKNIYTTGEINNVEQSLVVLQGGKAIIITGCSHSGVPNILKKASEYGEPHALIGGLHGFSEFGVLENLSLVCATHCTRFTNKIKKLYPDKFMDGGAGRIIEI